MKLTHLFAYIIVSVFFFAQQVPAQQLVQQTPARQAPMPAPRVPDVPYEPIWQFPSSNWGEAPQVLQQRSTLVLQLLQAQTEAIKSLSVKLDLLEERILEIEKRSR